MNDREPAHHFVKLEPVPGALRVLVGAVSWDGPQSPSISWALARELPEPVSDDEIDRAVAEVRASADYFATCEECGQRNPLGWMHDERVCQSCAQQTHGVIY